MNPRSGTEPPAGGLPASEAAPTPPLGDVLAPVRPWLDRVNAELLADLAPQQPDLAPMVDLAASFRGKQLRPALVFLAGSAAGKVRDDHVQVAKIVELIHTATLVHDDVLDGATLRRRQPTVNASFGTEVPVLLGDYIYARAFHMAVQLDDPACSRVLAEATRRICQGEITQIVHRFDFDWDEPRYYQVILEKTALLYGAACRLGAHYAGGDVDAVESLDRYGLELGIAFQIVDDCLDLEGDEDVVGKSLGTDLGKGKLTLPLLRLMAEPGPRAALEELMRSDLDEAAKLDALRSDFAIEDALAYSRAAARKRVANALDAVAELPASEAREAMEGIAHYVLARQL